MDALDERLANLGKTIAEVNGPDHEAIADARRRWTRTSRQPRGRRWTLVVAPALVIAAAVIAVVVFRTSAQEQRALTYTVGDAPGESGQWIAAREPVRLSFSDGSRVEVSRNAKVRVATTDARGSTIDLEQGSLHADVAHRDISTWNFRTGPYTVLVKGTRFDAAWDPNNERFTLEMLEGRVEVMGPLLRAPVTVSAGQALVASVREQRFEIRAVRTADGSMQPQTDADGDKHTVAAPVLSTPSNTQPTTEVTQSTAAPSGNGSQAVVSSAPSNQVVKPSKAEQPPQATSAAKTEATATTARKEKWREYLAARAYSAAIKAAEQRGFDTVLADATSAELYTLSDAARYARQLARARDALISLRARFGEQGKTAFLLGRIAADQGDAAVAIEWFDRYLREQPGGPLAETATGRLIELYQPRDASRARKLAERYLAAYPDGSYAALARTLTEK